MTLWRCGRLVALSIFFFIFLAGSFASILEAYAQDAPPAKKHDIIILIDNSRSIASSNGGLDTEMARIRMVRFLARYLKTVAPEQATLGAARFAFTTTELVSQKPSSNWTSDDFAQILPEICPEPNTPGDPCKGTHRSDALEWARMQLADCNMSDSQSCDIILVTDPRVDEGGGSDTLDEIKTGLEDTANDNINLHIVLFDNTKLQNERNSAEKLPAWEVPKNQDQWIAWQEEGLISSRFLYMPDPDDPSWHGNMLTEKMYDAVLTALGFGVEFHELNQIEVTDAKTVALAPFPPLMKQIQLDVIPDPVDIHQAINVAFPDVSPPITAEVGYRWLLPDFDALTMSLNGNGLVFFRSVSEIMPADVFITAWPKHQKSGKPISIQAVITGNNVLLDDDRTQVIAYLSNRKKGIDLLNVSPGVWSDPGIQGKQSAISLVPGEHIITATVSVDDLPIPIQLHPAKISITKSFPRVIFDIFPTEVFTDQAINFDALFLIDEKVIDISNDDGVYVKFSPVENVLIPLTYDDMKWHANISLAQALGEELLSTEFITATIEVPTEDETLVWKAEPIRIHVLAHPKLELLVSKTEARPGERITVTVRTEGIAHPMTPTLISIPSSDGEIKWRQGNKFAGEVSIPDNSPMLLSAIIPYTNVILGQTNMVLWDFAWRTHM